MSLAKLLKLRHANWTHLSEQKLPQLDRAKRSTAAGTSAAILFTAVWVIGASAFAATKNAAAMRPNEWGDFFAGASAPLAFLWLVMGFFQQAKALRIQGDDLKASLELTSRELKLREREASERERDRVDRERRAAAHLWAECEVLPRQLPGGDGEWELRIWIGNHNTSITKVFALVWLGIPGDVFPIRYNVSPLMERGAVQKLSSQAAAFDRLTLHVEYVDDAGKGGSQSFELAQNSTLPGGRRPLEPSRWMVEVSGGYGAPATRRPWSLPS